MGGPRTLPLRQLRRSAELAMPARIEDLDQALPFLLRHPLRKRLLRLYLEAKEDLSPKELADYTREPLSTVALHVRVLRDQGAVELVRERPCRGAVEHFYRPTGLVDAVPWAREALGLHPEPKGSDTEARDRIDEKKASHAD